MSVGKGGGGSAHLDGIAIGWKLLSEAEKRRLRWLAVLVLFSGCLDIVSVTSILPLLGYLVSPARWEAQPVFQHAVALIGNPERSVLVPSLGICVLALLLLSAATNALVRWKINRFAAECRVRLAEELAKKCVDAPFAWHLQRNAAITSRLINLDVSRWSADYVMRMLSSFQALALVLVAVGLILFAAPLAGLLAIALVALLMLGIHLLIGERLSSYTKAERALADTAAVSIQQLQAGIKDVKLSGNPHAFVRCFVDAARDMATIAASRNTIRQIQPTVLMLLGQSILLVIILILWWRGDSPQLIAEQMVFIALIAARLVPAANRFFTDIGSLWDIHPYTRGLYELEHSLTAQMTGEKKLEILEAPIVPKVWSVLQLEGLTYVYPTSKVPAVCGISLQVRRNRWYGIVGPSGSGKTTLVDILLGLLKPQAGYVSMDGIEIQDLACAAWQARIGYVPQTPYIIDDTLRANIAFGVATEDVDDEHVLDCLRLANLEEVVSGFSGGLDQRLGDRGQCLSGGQRQRVAIARALYKKPDLLVLDEATSALDTLAEESIQDAIERMHGLVTVITIAHRMSTIRNCDDILVIESGRLVATGSFNELLDGSPLFRQMVGSMANGKSHEAAAI